MEAIEVERAGRLNTQPDETNENWEAATQEVRTETPTSVCESCRPKSVLFLKLTHQSPNRVRVVTGYETGAAEF